MDNRMLERIVIIILLVLNGFLAVTVLSDRAETRRSNAEIAAYVVDVLADNGITASEKTVIVQPAPKAGTLTRSSQKEAEIIRGLLGKATPEDMGGNITLYHADKGQFMIRGSGEVAALYMDGAIPMRLGPEQTTRRLLRRAGVDAVITGPDADSGAVYADAYCCWNGYPVYNAVLHFNYGPAGLATVSGTRVFDSETEAGDSTPMDSVSALLRFVEIVRNEGIICSRLDSVEPGYLQMVVSLGESSLTPVWRIETDTGVRFINAETGALENAAA